MMQCCCVRGDDKAEPETGGFFNLWRPTAGRGSGAGSPRASPDEDDNLDDATQTKRSIEVVERHTDALAGEPNLLLYIVSYPQEVSSLGRNKSFHGDPREQKQRAYHIPPNTLEAVPIETEYFVGKVIVMYKPAGGVDRGDSEAHPYDEYFRTHKRHWEFRVQGRFKQAPTGDMQIGIVLRDFNYNQAVASYSMIVQRACMSLVKYDSYMSWGDRCEAANKRDAELSHLVTNMTAWDQIIVTPKGRTPPPLMVELTNLGDAYGINLQRTEMGLPEYGKAVTTLFSNISTEDTYTMCFWGVSQVIDLLKWSFKIGTSVSMERFFEDSPIHVAMYEVDRSNSTGKKSKQQLESAKKYYLDFMFWSNSVSCPALPARYIFKDAEAELERFSAMHCNPLGHKRPSFHSCNSLGVGVTREFSPPANGGWLASLSRRLRWIPSSTCDSCRLNASDQAPAS